MKWLHNLLKCLSFSTVLFTFEACYGCMEDECGDYGDNELVLYVVDSEDVGIPNVEVRLTTLKMKNEVYYDTTNNAGMVYINKWYVIDGYDVEISLKPLKGVDFQAKDTCFQYHTMENKYITVTLDRK